MPAGLVVARTGCGDVTGSSGGEGVSFWLIKGNRGSLVGRSSLALGTMPLMFEAGVGVGSGLAGEAVEPRALLALGFGGV